MRIFMLAALAACAFVTASAGSQAQDYPTRQITIVLPYPPGSVLDALTREIADRLQKKYAQPVIVENKDGASGNIGTEFVARAAPDGYTLLLTTNAPLLFNKYTIGVNIDPRKDLAPIVLTSEARNSLAVTASVPVNSVQEFIAYAKANPGKLSYASSGIGSPHHIDGEYFKDLTGIDIEHVPYRGSLPAITDLASGSVQVGFVTYGNVLPFVRSGKVKVLGLVGDVQNPLAPEIPLIRDTVPGYLSAPSGWNGMFAPAGTPRPIIEKLNRDINEALNDPALQQKQAAMVSTVLGGPPEALVEKMRKEEEIGERLAGKIGMKAK